MNKKPIIYYKKIFEGMIIYTCDTDFSKYEYSPDFTLYKKGWFREHEKEVVIMITDVMKPQADRHKYIFNIPNEKKAIGIINNYIKENLNKALEQHQSNNPFMKCKTGRFFVIDERALKDFENVLFWLLSTKFSKNYKERVLR